MAKYFKYEYTDSSIIEEHLLSTVAKAPGETEKIEFDNKRAFRITKKNSRTDVILTKRGKTLLIDSCANEETNPCRIIGELAKIGVIKSGKLPLTDEPLTADDETAEYLGMIMLQKTKPEHPIVYLSMMKGHFNTCGFEINQESLARRLWGLATVVIQGNEATTSKLHKESNKREPSNGCVGIYYPDGKYNIVCDLKLSKQGYSAAEDYIVYEIERFHAERCSYNSDTYDSIHIQKLKAELTASAAPKVESAPIHTATAVPAEDERDKQIEWLKNAVSSLEADKKLLTETLKQEKKDIIIIPAVPELRKDEFNDLFFAALTYWEQNTSDDCKRRKFLLKKFIAVNSDSGYEENLKKHTRQAFKDDKWEPQTLFSDFKEISYEGKKGSHYKFSFAEWVNFPICCTPSDSRTRNNEVRDCFKVFCVT